MTVVKKVDDNESDLGAALDLLNEELRLVGERLHDVSVGVRAAVPLDERDESGARLVFEPNGVLYYADPDMSIVDDYGGAAHVDGCAYCRGRWRWRGDPWEWFAKPYSADWARFAWSSEVASIATSVLRIPVHPVTHENVFVTKRNWGRNSDRWVALPYCAEEALRHCQYKPHALEKLFRKLNDAGVRAGAGAAFRLGGSFALRDYLRGEGAL